MSRKFAARMRWNSTSSSTSTYFLSQASLRGFRLSAGNLRDLWAWRGLVGC